VLPLQRQLLVNSIIAESDDEIRRNKEAKIRHAQRIERLKGKRK
jgi:hypothetical protein